MPEPGDAPTIRDGEVALAGRVLTLERTDKVLDPETGTTKGELIAGVLRLAPLSLAYLRGRPLTVRRFPDGVDGPSFFEKQAPAHAPDWIPRVTLSRRERAGTIDHLLVEEPAALAWLASMAALELHVALVTAEDLEHPLELVLDLDPSEGTGTDVTRRATRRVLTVLGDLGLDGLVRTSGSRGFHVHVPSDRSADVETVADLARSVAHLLAERHPDELTVAHRKADRGDRVFVDWLRNNHGQTVIAPYGTRARAGVPIATPLARAELSRTAPQDYHLGNIFRRLGQRRDPWEHAWNRGQDLPAAAARFAELAA